MADEIEFDGLQTYKRQHTDMNSHPSPKRNVKIECKTRRSVLALLQSVQSHVSACCINENVLGQQNELMQQYKLALWSAVQINGHAIRDESDLDTTTEYEPFDTSKEQYIQHELMPRMDKQIVDTTRLRKFGSAKLRKKVKILVRPELKYMSLAKVETVPASRPGNEDEEMEIEEAAGSHHVSVDDINSRLAGVVEMCSSMKENSEELLQKSQHLAQAQQIFKQSEKSEITKALYETPPNTPTAVELEEKHLHNKDILFSKKLSQKLLELG